MNNNKNNQAQLHRYNQYKHLLLITINICISSFHFGFCNSYFNTIRISDFSHIFNTQQYQLSTIQGILTGIVFLTGGIGAYYSKLLIQKYSRIQCFQILSTCIIFICFILLIPNLYLFFIGRCLQGICVGMISSITPLYIREFSPTQLAGRLCPWNQIGMVLGITFSFVLTFILSLFLSVQIYWRIVFGFPIITCAIQLYNIIFNYHYQTPKWLLLQGKKQKTKQLLAIIYKKQYVQDIYNQLKAAINKNNNNRESTLTIQEDFPNIQQKNRKINGQLSTQLLQMNKQNKQTINKIKTLNKKNIQLKSNPLAIFTAIHLHIHQQLAGTSTISLYSGLLMKEMFPFIQRVYPIFINLVGLLGAFLVIPILKKTGRKNNLIYGSLIQAILLFILAYCFSIFDFTDFNKNSHFNIFLICILMIVIRTTFACTTGPVVWIYVSETVQPNIVAIATTVNWMTIAIANTLFPIIKDMCGGNPYLILLFFGTYTLLSFFVSRKVLIQTQGKNQVQIMSEYQEKWQSIKNK